MFKKFIYFLFSVIAALSFTARPVFAHAVVKPATAGIGSFTDFSLGVPAEKAVATIAVKLIIPDGLENLSPIVKPGWKIDVKKTADTSGKKDDDGNPAMIVSELDWTGGSVPAGQKDFFMFSAQVPPQPTELDWKVVQTYADGSVVTWDKTASDQPKDEKGNPDFSNFGPFSKTMVVNDLKPSVAPVVTQVTDTATGKSSDSLALMLSGLAVILSLVALTLPMMKKKQPVV